MQKILPRLPLVLANTGCALSFRFFSLFLILFMGATLPGASGQSRRAYLQAGDEAFEQKNYGVALQHYTVALERKPDDATVMWKYAESARLIHSYSLAEKMYRRLEETEDKKRKNPLVAYRLGEVVRSQGRYEEASAHFERFLAGQPGSDFSDQAQANVAACRWALQQAGGAVEVTNAGKGINSPFSDFAPFIAGDTLFFSSYRFDKRAAKGQPKTKLTKVMFSVNEGRAREATRGFPSIDSAHVAHTAFFAEDHFLFLTLCKNLNASDIRCELWLAVQDIRKRWGPPVRLPEPINLPGYTTTHPSVSYDSLTEQMNLWFASDRPGGKGGLDLWVMPLDTNWFCPCSVPVDSRKPLRMPEFEDAPVNLDLLNTSGNDATPFFHEATRSLYFSSDGREGFGGYDIYRSNMTDATLGVPENAGPGLNSSYNDLYFTLRPDGKRGYLSSNRTGSQYLDEANQACCNDIFSVRFPEPPKDIPPTSDAKTPPEPMRPIERPMIPVEQLQPKMPEAPPPVLADFVGLPLFFDNDEPDKRTQRTRTNKNYVETVQAYLERQAEYRDRFSTGLTGPARDAAEMLIDSFFDTEVRRGYERLDQLCELLLVRLKTDEPVEVIIKGFTSPRAESTYNLSLGKRRISSVRNYFDVYGDGVLGPYIKSGLLKVSEASFGETTARSGISDDLRDERNSVYHPDAARERRVEIVEIRERR